MLFRSQFRETDSSKLLQQKLPPFVHLNFVFTWVALLISYLANIWSRVRLVCSNYFDFKKIKPRLESIGKANASMTVYSKASENCYKDQSIAEWGDVKSEPFGYLTQKPFSQHDRLASKKCTFSLSMCDHIFYMLLKINYTMILITM